MTTFTPLFAQASSQGNALSFLLLAFMVVVFYFLLIRPQRRRMRQQQQVQAELTVGDRVETIGGLVGRVRKIDDDSVVLDIESGQLRVVRRAISSRADKNAG